MRKNASEHLEKPFEHLRAERHARACRKEGCTEEGHYPAPVSRERPGEYIYFCLDHVREYNRAWNYYAGLTPGQVEAMIRRDTVWNRPSWPFSRGNRYTNGDGRLADDFDLFAAEEAEAREANATPRPPTPEERRAFGTLGLTAAASFEQIRTRYRELVKSHHPDTNGGDKAAEERLKVITRAYATLKALYASA